MIKDTNILFWFCYRESALMNGLFSLLAHVSYVVDPEILKSAAGRDWDFLLEPLTNGFYITLIIITIISTMGLIACCELIPALRRPIRNCHDHLVGYREFIPLVIRLALGVALVVAGTKSAIYLPNVIDAKTSSWEVVIGFCLLVGLMGRLCGIAALGVFFYGLWTSHYLLGTMESAAAALLMVAYGNRRPSVDDLLGFNLSRSPLQPLWDFLMENTGVILRLALGFTLIWLAITEKAFNPRVCEAVVIEFQLESLIPVSTAMWVFSVGVIEFAVGLLLVIGFFTRTFSFIAFIVLTLSFFYFKEEVAGHVTFFGALLVLFITGAGNWSVDAYIAKRTRGVNGTMVPYQTSNL